MSEEVEEPRPGWKPPEYPAAHGWRLGVRIVFAVAILGFGMFVMRALVAAKPEAERKPEDVVSTPVEVTTVHASSQKLVVSATGTVLPARQVIVGAEVAGRVVWLSPEMVPGGRFKAGLPLLRVDARDYKLAVEQQTAQVTIARTELEVEKSRKRIAEKEAALVGGAAPEPGSLALRDPQLKSAEGAVKAAESGLQRTRLAVSKTGIAAPFNAMVLTRAVDLGQLVGPGAPLATLVGTDAFWIQVSIPIDRLLSIDVPGYSGATAGSTAIVRQRMGDKVVEREGRVIRLVGDLDPIGRMVRVIVEVTDPLALASPGKPPLLLNSFVEVDIAGDDVAEVIAVPRAAVRENGVVWVMQGDVLAFRTVEVVWRTRDAVIVRGALRDGDMVIVSPLAAPVEGTKLRVVEPRKQAAKKP
jgi:RND family efflux transporter MFP subunit